MTPEEMEEWCREMLRKDVEMRNRVQRSENRLYASLPILALVLLVLTCVALGLKLYVQWDTLP